MLKIDVKYHIFYLFYLGRKKSNLDTFLIREFRIRYTRLLRLTTCTVSYTLRSDVHTVKCIRYFMEGVS